MRRSIHRALSGLLCLAPESQHAASCASTASATSSCTTSYSARDSRSAISSLAWRGLSLQEPAGRLAPSTARQIHASGHGSLARDYYDVLEVPKSASEEEIKK